MMRENLIQEWKRLRQQIKQENHVTTKIRLIIQAKKIAKQLETLPKFTRPEDRQPIIGNMRDISAVLNGAPVVKIDESQINMPKEGGFKAIELWASRLFAMQGGYAVNPLLGRIELNARAIKTSLAHNARFSPYKNIAFAAIKSVLEEGALVASDFGHELHNSYFVSAPILINEVENVVTVTIHRDLHTQKMYLHSVTLKENLLKPRMSEARKLSSRQHIGSLTSTDIHNILHEALTFKEE
jgi:virB12